MKLDVKAFRYLTPEDWRVLTAFETGSKNHEVVPTQLAAQLSGLRTGSNGVTKSISTLARAGLIAKTKNAKYDGYRLTYGGLDYLAMHAHTRTSSIVQLGSPMGVGKESDIWLCTCPSALSPSSTPVQSILKIHRLGRISFRTASTNRSYQGRNRSHCSWQVLSRLSAQQEYKAMRVLYDVGFRVPRPIAQNRHTVVMSLVPGVPLRQVPMAAFGRGRRERESGVAALYAELIEVTLMLAGRGLIHGDLNEFNVLIEGVSEDFAEEPNDSDAERNIEDDDADDDDHDEYVEREKNDNHNPQTEPEPPTPPTQPPSASPSIPPTLIPHLIDFPQITSLSHPQALEFFDRDIRGIKAFFRKKYHFESDDPGPSFEDALARLKGNVDAGVRRLDVEVGAAGFVRGRVGEGRRGREMGVVDRVEGEEGEEVGSQVQDGEGGVAYVGVPDGEDAPTEERVDEQKSPTTITEAEPPASPQQTLAAGLKALDISASSKLHTHTRPHQTDKAAAGWSI